MGLKTDFLWLFVSRTFTALLSFFIWALVNRSLGPDNRGVVGEIQTWLGLFVLAFSFGLDSAVYHYANREQYGEDDASRLATMLVLAGLYTLIGSFFIYIFSLTGLVQFSAFTSKHITIVCLLFSAQILTTHLITFIQSLNRVRITAILQITQALLNALIIGGGYISDRLDLLYVLINLLVLQYAMLILACFFLLKAGLFKAGFKQGFKAGLAKKMLQAGLKQYIGNIAGFVYTKINQLIVLRYCGTFEAGLFSVSLNLASSLLIVTSSLQTALYPRVLHGHDDYEITIKTLRTGFYLWGLLVLIIMVLAVPILFLYGGEKYLAAANIFRLHMLSVWFLPLSSFISPYYIKKGAFMKSSLLAVILSIFSFGLNIFFIPRYGSMAGALVTAVSCLTGFIMSVMLFSFLSRRNAGTLFYPDFRDEYRYFKKFITRT